MNDDDKKKENEKRFNAQAESMIDMDPIDVWKTITARNKRVGQGFIILVLSSIIGLAIIIYSSIKSDHHTIGISDTGEFTWFEILVLVGAAIIALGGTLPFTRNDEVRNLFNGASKTGKYPISKLLYLFLYDMGDMGLYESKIYQSASKMIEMDSDSWTDYEKGYLIKMMIPVLSELRRADSNPTVDSIDSLTDSYGITKCIDSLIEYVSAEAGVNGSDMIEKDEFKMRSMEPNVSMKIMKELIMK